MKIYNFCNRNVIIVVKNLKKFVLLSIISTLVQNFYVNVKVLKHYGKKKTIL